MKLDEYAFSLCFSVVIFSVLSVVKKKKLIGSYTKVNQELKK